MYFDSPAIILSTTQTFINCMVTNLQCHTTLCITMQNKLFSKTWSSRVRRITVTRSGVVMYKDATIYVKIQGRIKYRFRRIRVLQVNNKIEGNLKFIRNASPRTRVFPGYGEPPLFEKFCTNTLLVEVLGMQ